MDSFSIGLMCLRTSGYYTQSKFLPGTVEKNSSTIRAVHKIHQQSEQCTVKCHKSSEGSEVPQNSSTIRAVHRHRTGVGSIPAGGPYS